MQYGFYIERGEVTAVANGKCTIKVASKATENTSENAKSNIVTTVEVFVGTYMEQVVQKSAHEYRLKNTPRGNSRSIFLFKHRLKE